VVGDTERERLFDDLRGRPVSVTRSLRDHLRAQSEEPSSRR
jgi:hypothetical protein